ncbi:MAG TPA: glycosyltransferase [Candidatus Saccharimonadaceae bacterium]|nr:glycosyltransferase [Candidatus Saccharimonadaceae bacterium]
MNVAHLDTGRTWRGGQAQVLLLMRGLRARGHASTLLAPDGPLAERARAESFAHVRWEGRGDLDVAAVWSGARALKRVAPDVAHCHSAHAHALGVPAARLAGVPGVVVSRRVDFRVATQPFSRIKYRFPVDRYLCISRGVADVLRAAGLPERRLALVPSGIELPRDDEPAPDLRATLGLAAGAPIVGTVAALAPHKDHATLLAAAARVVRARPDAHFAWIGEGECRPALERERAALGLEAHVHVMGFRPDARALMRQFTLFALSSHLEGLCTSLLDAEARGVPIVATRVGGIPDVIEDGANGRLVAPRDPAALADALLAALADAGTRARWAAEGRRRVEAFSADAMVAGTLAQYQAVLAERAGSRATA